MMNYYIKNYFWLRNLKWLLIAFLSLKLIGIFWGFQFHRTVLASNTAFEAKSLEIFIDTDDSFDSLCLKLENHLKSIKSFSRLAKIKSFDESIRPGRFLILSSSSNNTIINTLRSSGQPINVVFNNQERIENLAGKISNQLMIDSLSLLNHITNDDVVSKKGFTPENALAMYIPNTYEFYWESDASTFFNRMYYEYQRFWNENRLAKAKSLELTPIEVIVLASIVHKETTKKEEMPLVAGVYLERLRRNMRLQADPTVIYTIKKHSGNFKKVIKRVLYRDLEIDSPFNTYLYKGLPPGPIITPDIASIEAVLNPKMKGYLYFVADVENPGYHKFSKTLSQHNRNRVKYIRWINSKGITR